MSKVVALGGGHGLAATLAALRQITQDITAIVTVADNGGSSGRLREEFPIFPPGDLRMALTALCADDDSVSIEDQMKFVFEDVLNQLFKKCKSTPVSRGKMLLDYIKEEEQEDFC
mgnify:CR=1 FL=1